MEIQDPKQAAAYLTTALEESDSGDVVLTTVLLDLSLAKMEKPYSRFLASQIAAELRLTKIFAKQLGFKVQFVPIGE